MTPGSEGDGQNSAASSQSLAEDITAINMQLSAVTLTSSSSPSLSSNDSLHEPPLPSLPLDLVEDILCRLPVKFLLQLRCVCKSWDSLISDPKFAKKHLRLSTTYRLHTISFFAPSRKFILTSYPPHSVLTTIASNATQQLEYPPYNFDGKYPSNHLRYIVGSCDGILCLADYYECFVLLWNPSIRKFKELPPMEKPKVISQTTMAYGFGYDAFTDNYKVVAVTYYPVRHSSGSLRDCVYKTEVKVHTLGTNFWRSIQDFPFGMLPVEQSGKFVCGTINWLASLDWARQSPCIIVSLDLEKESYQEVLQPDYGVVVDSHTFLTLGVLRDCLCMTFGHDVWVMNEFGNKESWTKLFTVSYMRDPSKYYCLTKAVYIFEDDQVLLQSWGDWNDKLIVYDSRNCTFKFTEFTEFTEFEGTSKVNADFSPEVCVESLISPSS